MCRTLPAVCRENPGPWVEGGTMGNESGLGRKKRPAEEAEKERGGGCRGQETAPLCPGRIPGFRDLQGESWAQACGLWGPLSVQRRWSRGAGRQWRRPKGIPCRLVNWLLFAYQPWDRSEQHPQHPMQRVEGPKISVFSRAPGRWELWGGTEEPYMTQKRRAKVARKSMALKGENGPWDSPDSNTCSMIVMMTRYWTFTIY